MRGSGTLPRAASDEVEDLRALLERLSARVEAQEEELRELREARSSTAEASEAASIAEVATEETASTYSWAFREEVAREIGRFLRRGLNGEHRGFWTGTDSEFGKSGLLDCQGH